MRTRGRRTSIATRVGLAVGAVVVAVAVAVGVTTWSIERAGDAAVASADEAQHETVPLLVLSDDVNEVARLAARTILDASAAPSARTALEERVAVVDRRFARLERSVHLDVEERVGHEAAAWRSAVATLRRTFREGVPIAPMLVVGLEPLLTEVSAGLRRTADYTVRDLQEKIDRSHATLDSLANVNVAVGVAAGVVVLLATLWLVRSLLRPVRRLRAGVLDLAHGDLDQPVDVTGPRELADLACVFNDMASDLRVREAELVYEALHDPLTGLANRVLLAEQLEAGLARLRRRPGSSVSVLYVDLDRFKKVNDTHGHAHGDEVLRDAAHRLRRCLREGDTVARVGGDEFAVVAEDIGYEATLMAERVCSTMRDPFVIEGEEIVLSASIGLATAHTGAESADRLLRDADLAMYEVKQRGGDGLCRYDEAFHERARQRLQMENDLRHALDAGRVEVHYQPVVDLRDRKVRGVEALVRWRDVDGRLIEPAEFLPLAQETGLIVPLGWHVLRRAVSDGAAWCKGSSTDDEPFTVAVNLSTRQIESPDFVERILDELDRADLAPEHLVLEVTETDMLESVSDTRHKLGELHRLGVRIALDDFGTGYTSLQYLRDYPVDILKIDRTFVQGVHRRTDLTTLVRTIVDLGEAFQLEIIAEGVEDRDESQALRRLRCRLAQGYAFYRPMPAGEIAAILAGAPVDEVSEPG